MSISILNTAEDSPLKGSSSFRLVREIRANAMLYCSILAFVLATLLLATVRGDSFLPLLQEYFGRMLRALLLICCVFVIVLGIRAMAQGRQQSPVTNLVAGLKGLAGSGLPLRYLYACTILAVFMAAFLYNKMLIPEIAPFRWDATFSRLDFALLGGHHPWQLIHPLLSTAGATFFLDVVYSSWVPMVFLFWAGAFASQRVPERLRVRFWTATVVSWVLIGLVMATMLSSAGPCYFTEFVSDMASPYVGLDAYLADISSKHPLSSTLAKEFLWQAYGGEYNLPGGISAMPSMHNAQAALFVAFAYSLNRRFGHVMLVYAVLIFVGSIHLGWHYAVDGIVGAAAAIAVWWFSGIALSSKAARAAEPGLMTSKRHKTQLAADVSARMKQILLADKAIYAIVALHAAVAISALQATGASSAFAYLAYFPAWPAIFLLFFPFIYAMLVILQVVHRLEKRRSTALRLILSEKRLAHFGAGLVLLCAMMIFQGTLTSVKNAFPIWRGGFPYDTFQADLDKLLHFGRDPWLYLYAAAGNGFVRAVVEWNYNQGWFIVCFSALFWVAVAYEARAVRTRYFLCYALVWILVGNILAGFFLSAGPAFYGQVTGDVARFAGQLAFLGESGGGMHSAARVQHYLWAFHERGEAGFGSGISAFPSMHVSLVTLNALFLLEFNRKAGLALFAYVALIVASSVYLAWHYAIDGYVAVVLTVAVYAVVRWMMNGMAAGTETTAPVWPTRDVTA